MTLAPPLLKAFWQGVDEVCRLAGFRCAAEQRNMIHDIDEKYEKTESTRDSLLTAAGAQVAQMPKHSSNLCSSSSRRSFGQPVGDIFGVTQGPLKQATRMGRRTKRSTETHPLVPFSSSSFHLNIYQMQPLSHNSRESPQRPDIQSPDRHSFARSRPRSGFPGKSDGGFFFRCAKKPAA